MSTAERLFGDHGIDGVSLRAINAAAGVGPAAVHYHFGSKQGLLEAVLLERGSEVLRMVLIRTRQLAARPDPPSARDLVDVIAGPYRALLESDPVRGLHWIKLVSHLTLADHDLIRRASTDIEPELMRQVHRSFPRAPADQLRMRWSFTTVTLIQMLGQVDRWLEGARNNAVQRRGYVDELIEFAAGGLEALRSQPPWRV